MIEVIREGSSRLEDQIWNFNVSARASGSEVELRLSYYAARSRPTLRHKMAVLGQWNNYNKRANTIETPPIPADVVKEAKSQITFKLVLPSGESVAA